MDKSKTSENMLPNLQSNDTATLAIIVALVVGLLTLLILLLRRRSAKRRNVLLLGLCDSGKTTIYCQLAYNKQDVATFTSIKENTHTYYPERKSALTIVDIPGHERLRVNYFNQYKSMARGIIYVVDSNTLPKDIKDVAEFLHTIVSDKVICQNKVPILVTCHKQDNFVKSKEVIQSQLEKEMDTVIMTQSAQLDSIAADKGNKRSMQKKGGKHSGFQFSDMLPVKIDFAESKMQQEVDMKGIKEWLEKIA